MKRKETPQWKRCYAAMLNGEVVSRKWAAKQTPIISQPGNRCNELLAKGVPVQKIMVYPDKGAHYMAFWFTKEYIQRVTQKLS